MRASPALDNQVSCPSSDTRAAGRLSQARQAEPHEQINVLKIDPKCMCFGLGTAFSESTLEPSKSRR